jgi:uncharacterized membrane protein
MTIEQRRIVVAAVIAYALVAVLWPAVAHEGEAYDTAEVTEIEGGHSSGEEHAPADMTVVQDGPTTPFTMPPVAEGLLHHLHNKLVHLPFGLAVAALLLYLMAFKDPKYGEAARWLVLIAALVAIPIYFTGSSQEEAFEDTAKEWLVEVHEKIGITTAITLWIWAVMGWLKPTQRLAWLWGLIVFGFLAAAGYYGGLVAHG